MKIANTKEINEYIDELISTMDKNIMETEHFNETGSSKDAVLLDVDDYTNNPYFKNIRPKRKRIGDVEIGYQSYKRGEQFLYDEIEVSDDGLFKEHNKIGYFDKEFEYLAIKKNGYTWMSVIPHEINTMRKAIEESNGNVVALGLGLGYFAYMASLKDDVHEVTILEKDKEVISLFKKEMLPFFEHKEKIKIIEGDALDELKKSKNVDYVFADLWHGAEDGLPLYSKITKIAKGTDKTTFSYWIEESILCLVRRALIILLDESRNASKDEDYEFAETFSDELINALYKATKEKNIRNINNIRDMLSSKSLNEIVGILGF